MSYLFKKYPGIESKIRTILSLRNHKISNFPRCKGKSVRKSKRLEAEGDSSHRSPRHDPCDICRCSHVAGWGTKGEFYGEGEMWKEVGHYGVGWCRDHEQLKNKDQCLAYARNT